MLTALTNNIQTHIRLRLCVGGYDVMNLVMQYNDTDRFRHDMAHIQYLMV